MIEIEIDGEIEAGTGTEIIERLQEVVEIGKREGVVEVIAEAAVLDHVVKRVAEVIAGEEKKIEMEGGKEEEVTVEVEVAAVGEIVIKRAPCPGRDLGRIRGYRGERAREIRNQEKFKK